MSTATRKAHSDIEFIEGEMRQASGKPKDWQDCEAILRLFNEAFAWVERASQMLRQSEASGPAVEELIKLIQRAIYAAGYIEAECATQLESRRDLLGLEEFRHTTAQFLALRDGLLERHEAAEAQKWAEIEHTALTYSELEELFNDQTPKQ